MYYFSAIRPMPTLAVASKFVEYPEYFEVFTSDNSLFRIAANERTHPRWSLDSSKSLSSFILLSALLSEEQLLMIFGHNFLDDSSLQDSFSAIMGENGKVVLDCVGTPEELRASLKKAHDKSIFENSFLMNYAIDRDLLEGTTPYETLLKHETHVFPESIKNQLLNAIGGHDV